MDLKMYILVNEDVKIGKGKLAGQVGHAVASYMYGFLHEEDVSVLDLYMNTAQKKIILKCPQSKLEELERDGYCVVIRDKGLTQLEPNTLTCVNLGIWNDETVPQWVKKLKLV